MAWNLAGFWFFLNDEFERFLFRYYKLFQFVLRRGWPLDEVSILNQVCVALRSVASGLYSAPGSCGVPHAEAATVSHADVHDVRRGNCCVVNAPGLCTEAALAAHDDGHLLTARLPASCRVYEGLHWRNATAGVLADRTHRVAARRSRERSQSARGVGGGEGRWGLGVDGDGCVDARARVSSGPSLAHHSHVRLADVSESATLP